uniref:Uncharacterized protein n=1 Tax=Arundo donax TaxID=35708 RepID=A0A0A8ZNH3_ARUDO
MGFHTVTILNQTNSGFCTFPLQYQRDPKTLQFALQFLNQTPERSFLSAHFTSRLSSPLVPAANPHPPPPPDLRAA